MSLKNTVSQNCPKYLIRNSKRKVNWIYVPKMLKHDIFPRFWTIFCDFQTLWYYDKIDRTSKCFIAFWANFPFLPLAFMGEGQLWPQLILTLKNSLLLRSFSLLLYDHYGHSNFVWINLKQKPWNLRYHLMLLCNNMVSCAHVVISEYTINSLW